MTTAAGIIQASFREGNLIPIGKQPSADQATEALDKLNRLVRGILGYKMGENLRDWLIPISQRVAAAPTTFPQGPLAGGYGDPMMACATMTDVPPNNRRIVFGGTTSTVYFPSNPNPGAQMAVVQGSGAADTSPVGDVLTLNGNGRTIQTPPSGAFTNTVAFTFASPPATPRRWFYRDDLAQWVEIATLTGGDGSTYTDNMPYPPEFDDFFVCALTKRLAPSYNKIVAKETIQTALNTECAFLARYRQPTDTVYGSDQFPRSYQSYINGTWWW